MNIVVAVKHVPETGSVTLDEQTGTMRREGVESIPNPLDLYGIEAALRLRERYGGTVAVVSMGPAGAERTVRECLAMGCDRGVLVTGKEFAGSDTLVTSKVLSGAIRKLVACDLLIFGERATDGDTGQVGPATAALLAFPIATYVSAILELRDDQPVGGTGEAGRSVVVDRLTEAGYERFALRLPAAMTVVKEIASPRLPTLRGKTAARTAEIDRWSAGDLGLPEEELGLRGSPTRVEKIFHPRITRDGRLRVVKDEDGLEDAAEELADFILSHVAVRRESSL
jgi:electron transfer flavoprotein beta subunit